MATKWSVADVQHVVHISTNVGKSCEHCSEWVGTDRVGESINHYLQKHGYKLLHVGTETDRDPEEGKLVYFTVAVVGK